MSHLAPLIRDLAILLATAGIISAIFQRLRLPVVLGYLVAGIALGQAARRWSVISDFPNVRLWGELGIIFLMFSLGLEFSFRKLSRVGLSSVGTALFEMASLFGCGFALARFGLHWSARDSVLLGTMASVSSTTIILKTLDELGLRTRRFAEAIFGVLIVEDLVAILMIVALTTLGQSRELTGLLLLGSAGKLLLVVGSWFLVGYFVVPRLVRLAGSRGGEEMLTVLATGLCLGLAVLADQFGYSVALGAFIMGSILAESSESHRIEELVKPLRDVFAAIFFVSIGMLLDLDQARLWWPEALALTALVLAGKSLFVSLGALITGQSFRTAIQIGLGMAQIGEFSFIIAGLAIVAGPRQELLYPMAVAASLITSFTTPLLNRVSHRVAHRLEYQLPPSFREFLNRYAAWCLDRRADRERRGEFYLRLFRWVCCGIAITVIHVVLAEWLPFPGSLAVRWLLAAMASAPFLWAMLRVFDRPMPAFGFGLLTVIWLGLLSREFFPTEVAAPLTLGLVAVLVLAWTRRLEGAYRWFEKELLSGLSGDQPRSGRRADIIRGLAPWDAHLVRIKVHPNSEVVGFKIKELGLRSRFGLNIVVIRRGLRFVVAPSPELPVFPKDELLVLGTDEQVESARTFLEHPPGLEEDFDPIEGFELRNINVDPGSPLVGRSLRDCAIRERFGAMVVGIEREGKRLLNPDSQALILPGDALWLVGEIEKIEEFRLEAVTPSGTGNPG